MNSFLLPLSAGFRCGVALRQAGYRHGWFKTRHLDCPVVSVGNLTVGGTGKTPLVAAIANILLRQGLKPSILTRGYGRTSKPAMLVVAPGSDRRLDAQEIGDEPVLLARALPAVPIIICADRFRGGQAAEKCFQVDAHVLDDGFQHLALARDVDVVVVDATQNLSDQDLLPAGRQREPLSALRRAHIVVLTRCDATNTQALEELVGRIHPAARIFHSRTGLLAWEDALNGEPIPADQIRGAKVAAFCALGNPRAFFADLRRWGFTIVAEDAFPDHHVYTGGEMERLVAEACRKGAAALLTTQKDAVKLSRDWKLPLPVLACRIEAQILESEAFESTLLSFLPRRTHDCS